MRQHAASPAPKGPRALPNWFGVGLLAAASLVLAGGSIGLLLACLGSYHLWIALPLSLIAAAGVMALGWPTVTEATAGRSDQLAAALMLAVVATSMAVNIAFDSSHVQVNRDPGAYAVTGKWIATQGNLRVPAAAAWAESGVAVRFDSLGTYADSAGRVDFQFDHFVPALLAEADDVGGDGLLFAMPAILGAVALAVIYAVGCRVLRRPWIALAAVTALAVSMPQLNISRDTYSEAGTQLLLWTGLWLLTHFVARREPRTALLVGLFLGSTVMTRVDAVGYLIPLPVLAGLWWLDAKQAEADAGTRSEPHRQPLQRSLVFFLAGLLPTAALGTFDLLFRSRAYFLLLRSEVLSLWVALLACLVLGAVLTASARRLSRFRLARAARALSLPVAAVVGLGLFAMWRLRPVLLPAARLVAPNDVVSGLQASEHQPVDAFRSYAEHSLTWMSWYLGSGTLILAIVGIAVGVQLALAGRRPEATVLLLVLGMTSLLYLWRPSIVPDQIWASRRFVPAVMPLLVLGAAAVVVALFELSQRFRQVGARCASAVLVVAVALAGVVIPARTSARVGKFTAQAGFDSVIRSTCTALGSRAAVVFQPGGRLELTWPQTVRSWCGTPTAILNPGTDQLQVTALASAWQKHGRTLWVLSSSEASVRKVELTAAVQLLGAATSNHELAQTISRVPYKYDHELVAIYGAKVD